MKRKIGLAASVALVLLGALAPSAFAQCTNILIKWDADCFIFETDGVLSAVQPDGFQSWKSVTGSQLTVVGFATLFCSPFADLVPDLPNKEYSFVWTGLTAQAPGTGDVPFAGTGRRWATTYSGGNFYIYEDAPADAPRETTPMPPAPPNVTVPVNFQDGTLVLEGTLGTLNTSVTRSAANVWTGAFVTSYIITGGSLAIRTSGWNFGSGFPVQGNWCTKYPTGCTPSGYTAHANGQFIPPPTTPATRSTWGAIKELYR